MITASDVSTTQAQLAVIGYIKLSRVRSYLLHARHVTAKGYGECLDTIEPAMDALLHLTAGTVTNAALDFILYSVDWEE
jgi:hypothetical protein